jgi:hypothetical protein
MDEPEDRRWTARRKFWFPSGILVDRRASLERRSGTDRRRPSATSLAPGILADRRAASDRRASDQRRSGERRVGPRRPTDRSPEPPN